MLAMFLCRVTAAEFETIFTVVLILYFAVLQSLYKQTNKQTTVT